MPEWLAKALYETPSPPPSPQHSKVDREQLLRDIAPSTPFELLTPLPERLLPEDSFTEGKDQARLEVQPRGRGAAYSRLHDLPIPLRPTSRQSISLPDEEDDIRQFRAVNPESSSITAISTGIFARPASTSIAAKRAAPFAGRFDIGTFPDTFNKTVTNSSNSTEADASGSFQIVRPRTPSQVRATLAQSNDSLFQQTAKPFSSPFRRDTPDYARGARNSIFHPLPTIFEDDERSTTRSMTISRPEGFACDAPARAFDEPRTEDNPFLALGRHHITSESGDGGPEHLGANVMR